MRPDIALAIIGVSLLAFTVTATVYVESRKQAHLEEQQKQERTLQQRVEALEHLLKSKPEQE